MPYHRVQRDALHDTVEAIEYGGEAVITVIADGDHYDIFTRYLGPPPLHYRSGEVSS